MRKTGCLILVSLFICAGCDSQKQQIADSKLPPQGNEQVVLLPGPAAEEPRQSEPVTPQIEQQPETAEAGDIKITVRIFSVGEQDFPQLEQLWDFTTQSFIMKRRTDLFPRSGLKVQMATGDLNPRLDKIKKDVRYSRDRQLVLRLNDGQTGYFSTAETINVSEFHYLNRKYNSENYNFKTAHGGFRIKVRKVPQKELINFQLIPVLSDFLAGGGDEVFDELMAAVTVMPGQSVLIGASNYSQNNFPAALFGLPAEGRAAKVIVINAFIL